MKFCVRLTDFQGNLSSIWETIFNNLLERWETFQLLIIFRDAITGKIMNLLSAIILLPLSILKKEDITNLELQKVEIDFIT